jgi:hypothetical protein
MALLQAQLNDLHPVPEGPHALASDQITTVLETPRQTTIKTVRGPINETSLMSSRQTLQRAKVGKATPEEITGQILGLKQLIISGVNSAGYGDKRTEFRSLADLRQILNALEDELAGLLGGRGRVRQIRMTTQWDKGL